MILGVIVYHIAFFLSVSFAFLSEKKLKIFEKRFSLKYVLIFSYIIIFILNGTRDNVGTDYSHYKWVFSLAQRGEVYAIIEPGYWFINKLFANFDNGHRFVLGFMVILTYLNIYILSKREKIAVLIVPFLFALGFIFFSNNIVRQSYAITVFLIAIKYIEKKQFWYYLIAVFYISMFHISGLMLLPFYWLGKIRIKKGVWYLLVFLSVIIYKLNLFQIIVYKFASFIPKYNSFVGLKGHDDFAGNFGLTIILIILLGLLVNYFSKYLDEDNERSQIYYNFFMMGTCLSVMLFSSNYFYRFTFYLSFILILLAPLIINNIKSLKTKQTVFVLFFIITLSWWFKGLIFNDGDPLPYKSFLF